jgi:hypothetical protein
MTIFRGRPSFLVHLLPFSCLLCHLSFLGMWPYAIYLYVCPVYLSVCCLVVNCFLLRMVAARTHITGLVHRSAVLWWVGFVGGIFECTCFPNGSFFYFSCMVVPVLEYRWLSHIHVCYSVCVAYAETGLLVLIYLIRSLCLVVMCLPDCPTYFFKKSRVVSYTLIYNNNICRNVSGNILPPSSGWPKLVHVDAEVNGIDDLVGNNWKAKLASGQSQVRSVETPPRLSWQRGKAIAMARETFNSCSQARVFCPIRESCLFVQCTVIIAFVKYTNRGNGD